MADPQNGAWYGASTRPSPSKNTTGVLYNQRWQYACSTMSGRDGSPCATRPSTTILRNSMAFWGPIAISVLAPRKPQQQHVGLWRGCALNCAGARRTTAERNIFRSDLLRHLSNYVLSLTVISAGDEISSGEMMRSASLSPTQLALTPGLKFVIRDPADASRRVISRPWEADPFIKDVAWMMARGRGSISRIIQNNIEITKVFA